MSDITWQEPPPARKGPGSEKTAFFDALRERPGEWALFPSSPMHPNAAHNIKRGLYSGVEAGEFDATARSRGDGTSDIYVRYVGEGDGL